MFLLFDYLKTLPPVEELSPKDITHKTVVRCQTIHALTVSGMRITNDVHFAIAKLLKFSFQTWQASRTLGSLNCTQ